MNSRRFMGLPQGQGSQTKYSRSWNGVQGRASQLIAATHVRQGSLASQATRTSQRRMASSFDHCATAMLSRKSARCMVDAAPVQQ